MKSSIVNETTVNKFGEWLPSESFMAFSLTGVCKDHNETVSFPNHSVIARNYRFSRKPLIALIKALDHNNYNDQYPFIRVQYLFNPYYSNDNLSNKRLLEVLAEQASSADGLSGWDSMKLAECAISQAASDNYRLVAHKLNRNFVNKHIKTVDTILDLVGGKCAWAVVRQEGFDTLLIQDFYMLRGKIAALEALQDLFQGISLLNSYKDALTVPGTLDSADNECTLLYMQ